MSPRSVALSGWGRWPQVEAELTEATTLDGIRGLVGLGAVSVRGAGRSYGDSSLGTRVLDMAHHTRMRSFDRDSGVAVVDAGATIEDLLRVFAPRGWLPAVTPGTRFVTVGGALASDVHGKNHHAAGSFSDHVLWFELLLGDGEVVRVSRESLPELFHATAGGMGLTGVILSVALQLIPVRSGRILQRSLKLPGIDATVAAIETNANWTYSAAWIDCQARGRSLGRSLLLLGEHDTDGGHDPAVNVRRPVAIPFVPPSGTLARPVVSAFNTLYHGRQRAVERTALVSYTSFFHPLDAIANWNLLYGKRGFLQYQFVTPAQAGADPLRRALALISQAPVPAPLAVLKAFGEANSNLLSFPLRGYTLAVDMPATAAALELCERLDRLVLDCGGRIYLSKDARMSPETFRACYPRWQEFEEIRARHGATGKFSTLQSTRLGLT
ncbi:FAD-binding oxidoreductase [Conexibacter sp. S30A1]|uniref:FAD-binding oxidoreductase n=1 Tax=Conexibacter sp. S30A1 TaxID=2937800 RepID=UPI00200D1F43|nr:FAD-binding oxidoreductase [Conexibacter sp. S30A1]